MTSGDVVSTIVGVLVIAGIVGAGFFVGRSSNLRATIGDQKTRIENLEGLVKDKDRELIEERNQRALLEARLAAVEAQAFQLSEIVSGRVDYSSLETLIASYYTELNRRFDDLMRENLAAFHDVKKLLEARRVGDA